MILTPLQKLPKNGEDWGKLIVAKGFKKFPKVQNIAQSGHTATNLQRSNIYVQYLLQQNPLKKSSFCFAKTKPLNRSNLICS